VKILICPDKFKGSLDARGVCHSIAKGIRELYPTAEIETVPLADGGEGTCHLLTEWSDGKILRRQVHGPLFEQLTAGYGISGDGQTAFVEMAEASGLMLLRPEQRNPLLTTTLGTGELIADALDQGVMNIILGIGGSATNDAGIGMASALGFDFVDASGESLKPIGENLIHLRHIRTDRIHPRLKAVNVIALCDVTNPLYGPQGAAVVYGPQKGADPFAVDLLDAGLRNFRRVVHKYLRISVDFPGAGAAGGLGAGARVFLNASMEKGINYMMRSMGVKEKIQAADLIITGEGKIDNQTFSGKVVSEIATLANREHKPVIAICGISELTPTEAKSSGVSRIISLVNEKTSRESAIANASELISRRIFEAGPELLT
jgi:glycerate kinase